MKYKFLILDTYHQDTIYLHEQGCEDPWLFFKAKRGPRAKKSLGNTAVGYRPTYPILYYTIVEPFVENNWDYLWNVPQNNACYVTG
jgi:hypothetical protein